ncbi:MAG: thiamine diphosphokinase [Mycobacterium leprae]
MRALVCAAGPIADYTRVRSLIGHTDFVLCADGGLRHARTMGIKPDLLLGDFDSIEPELLAEARAGDLPILQVPVEKDFTDTHLAFMEVLKRGATEVVVLGATGDRLDHTVANLLLLPGLPEGVAVTLVDAKNIVRLLHPGGRVTVQGAPGDFLSLLPLSPVVTGVTVEPVKWPLADATLRWGESLGVSNRLQTTEATVSIREGYLLVVQAWD